jgi:hypothetical protein
MASFAFRAIRTPYPNTPARITPHTLSLLPHFHLHPAHPHLTEEHAIMT